MLKTLGILLAIMAGFCVYTLSLIAFMGAPVAEASRSVGGWVLLVGVVCMLLSLWGMPHINRRQYLGVVLLVGTWMAAVSVLMMALIMAEPHLYAVLPRDSLSVFNDYRQGMMVLTLFSGLGLWWVWRGRTA